MIIPREHIEEQRKFVGNLQRIKYIHFRELYPNIDNTNFQICTKVDFNEIKDTYNNINETWDRLKYESIITQEFKSKTGSQYFMDDKNNLYRFSNHWSAIASCEWTLEGRGQLIMSIFETGDWEIGVANLQDFRIFRRKYDRRVDKIVNPEWLNQINTIIPLKDELHEMINNEEFKELPNEYKSLIGSSFGFFKGELKLYEENCNNSK